MSKLDQLHSEAVELLKGLIKIPSFSKHEDETARFLAGFFESKNCKVFRVQNNVWIRNLHFDSGKPTILLNSHHDTVKPNSGYTVDPFDPVENSGRLYGLGSNDAGGCLVALIATFLYFYGNEDLKYNLIFAASAEEEISGTNGIEALLEHLPAIDAAIVGEPTLMQLAIAERGLMVIDALATGQAGHAARDEGINALYLALQDIDRLKSYRFAKSSELLGPVKLSVTSISTSNTAHNVVPADCRFVIDVRVNEHYELEEILNELRGITKSELTPRSLRLRSTSISPDHPLVQTGIRLGQQTYGSPTTSDKALMPFPALKMGPGDSARSHTANEFIYTEEIRKGIELYIQMLNTVLL